MTTLTSNVQKGGALLDDTRRLVEAWDASLDAEENLLQVASGNLLGKTSRARTDDVLLRILKPRFVEPGPHVIAALATLLERPSSFIEACYYEAARDDALLATFAEGPLFDWYKQGRTGIAVGDVKAWLAELGHTSRAPAWSENVRTKVARGLLAALRDFRVLKGRARKEYTVPHMTPHGFAYVAFREHEQGASSRALVTSHVWRRWLLDAARVAELFNQAERLGVLRFSQAGSAVRVDWRVESLEEVTRAAA
jgi:hypothetical protein